MNFAGDRRLPTKPETAVFASGVASMGLEILAGRVIAPVFGGSIYTWGTIIGVFLAALALGYHYGGKRADTRASERRLIRLLALTAAYVAVLVVAGERLVAATAVVPLPGRIASLPAVTLLFGPPTYLLGFVSPYAAELSRTDAVGAVSGHVYAVGTVGSIVGAFGATYVLIPELAVETATLLFGVVLAATALALAAPTFERDAVRPIAVVVVLLVAAAGAPALGVSVDGTVVHEEETAYQELRVVDRGDVRTLYLDGQPHSARDREDPDRHVFDYTRYFHLPFLYEEGIDRVLFVGGGGFTGPQEFAREYDVTVDVVEIDPAVVDAAKRYFDLAESEDLRVHVDGGREFLRETDHTYDLIVLDAYKKDKVPFQLTTREFFSLTADRLSDDGVLYANVIAAPEGPASKFYRAEYRTMGTVFPQVYAFPTVGGPAVQNIQLIATKNGEQVPEATLRARNDRRDLAVDLAGEIDAYRATESTGDVPVLRDDRAPVDRLLDPMVGRRYVVGDNATAG